jgi:hypothetical protein
MKAHLLLFCCLTLVFFDGVFAQNRTPLRRADSYLGLHFDFHAGLGDTEIGKTLTEGMIDSLLTRVKPDFIQVDCKGHPGVSSYPTKVGHKPANFVKDPPRLFRTVTSRHGVALYVHYSGVWDNEAVKNHPHWARINADGKPDDRKASLWSAYTDSLLIPQLKEISDYGIDGVWVDGDCWALEPDYCQAAQDEFRFVTGIKEIPKKKGEPNYDQWVSFHRDAFRRYVRRYADALHAHNPRFQVASNWAFSSFMPQPVDVNVDFLSGDFDPANSVHSGAFQARCLANQGKPWDLMAWSFGGDFGSGIWSPKTGRQLCQEAAQVIVMGGGFQSYYSQNRDASIQPWEISSMEEVAKFCRVRQPYCFKAKPVPQVGLLYSTTAALQRNQNPYYWSGSDLDALKGTLNALLYSQLSTEIVMEHHLHNRLRDYPVLVVPEWERLEEAFRQQLLNYVRGGGNLVLISPKTVRLFDQEILGVRWGETRKDGNHLGYQNGMTATKSDYLTFEPLTNTQTFGGMYRARDLRFGTGAAASIATLGQGKIAAVYFDAGSTFHKNDSYVTRNFIGDLVKQLFQPQVRVEGSKMVQVAVNQKNKSTYINLLNMAGNHRSAYALEEIPPLQGLKVSIRTSQKPKQLLLQPDNKPLSFVFQNGEATFTLPKLDIHSIVEVR